jgi:hypothetical protein
MLKTGAMKYAKDAKFVLFGCCSKTGFSTNMMKRYKARKKYCPTCLFFGAQG